MAEYFHNMYVKSQIFNDWYMWHFTTYLNKSMVYLRLTYSISTIIKRINVHQIMCACSSHSHGTVAPVWCSSSKSYICEGRRYSFGIIRYGKHWEWDVNNPVSSEWTGNHHQQLHIASNNWTITHFISYLERDLDILKRNVLHQHGQ